MFVGRERELDVLRKMYAKRGFQMAVVYGRRRVGKTTLVNRFVQDKPTLYFTAQQKSNQQNLEVFSETAYAFFGQPAETPAFSDWRSALMYVAQKAQERDASGEPPMVFVFDEFPYAAESDPGLPSVLQVTIDHGFVQTTSCMILCGSNEGFMESEVLGRKSPLYGRRTAQMRVVPFDYLDAAKMLPEVSNEDLVTYYATFGGTPYYLAQVDPSLGYEQNIVDLLFSPEGVLYEEPLMLLRQELREPALYNSMLDAVGRGATAPSRIAEWSGVNQESISKYLKTLRELRIIERDVPFGENPDVSRKGLYSFSDPFFAYWYRFVSPNVGAIELGGGNAVARSEAFGAALATYVGHQFERVCMQWVVRKNNSGDLPFVATSFGRWWGTDPTMREQVDIDLVAANRKEGRALLGECKWRNKFDETEAIASLESRSRLLSSCKEPLYALFSKVAFSEGTKKKATARQDLMLVSLEDLFGC